MSTAEPGGSRRRARSRRSPLARVRDQCAALGTARRAARDRLRLFHVLVLLGPAADPRNDGHHLGCLDPAGALLGHVRRDARGAAGLWLAHLALPALGVPALGLPVLRAEHPRFLRVVQRAGGPHLDRARLFRLAVGLQPVRRRRVLEPDGRRLRPRAGGTTVRLHRRRHQPGRPHRAVHGAAARPARSARSTCCSISAGLLALVARC